MEDLAREHILDQTIEHAKNGHRNAQEIIKTLDGKTAVITGLSTLSSGFLISLVKWSLESPVGSIRNFDSILQGHPYFACAIYAALVAALLSGLLCLACALWSVIARGRAPHLKNPFTVLFPQISEDRNAEAERFFASRLKGITKVEILGEYEDQLRILGGILCRKIRFNRRACWCLLAQFLFTATAVALTAFLSLVQ